MIHVSRAVAARLEACEGATCAAHVQTHAALDPACRAEVRECGPVRAMFDGVDAPMTQTFGLGAEGPVDEATLDELEAFFAARDAATQHEVSPFAGVEAIGRLIARGYRPVELSNVMVRGLDDLPAPPALDVRSARADQVDAWVAASVAGWTDDPAAAAMIAALARVSFASPAITPVAVFDGDAIIATGALAVHGDVALLAGASTVPTARRRGAQRALLVHRLALARERGAAIAMMVAEVGSGSQRNAERAGYRVAYTRTKWSRAPR